MIEGVVTTFAGQSVYGSNDGVGTNARFDYPYSVTMSSVTGMFYVTDYNNNGIRRITSAGQMSV